MSASVIRSPRAVGILSMSRLPSSGCTARTTHRSNETRARSKSCSCVKWRHEMTTLTSIERTSAAPPPARLLSGGRSLWNVAAIAAQTPFYVYDFGVIDARIRSLRAVLPPRVDLHYAIKANPLPGLVQRIAPLVDGLDVASLRELQLALGTGVRPPNISFAGPGKKESELAAALAAGVVINVESASELARLERLQIETQQIARIALRVNPDFHVRGSGMGMGGGSQQFGTDAECIPQLAALVRHSRLLGLHIFAGSQNLKLEALTQAVSRTFGLAGSLCKTLGLEPEYLNIGGGLGIPYFASDYGLDLAGYAAHLTREASE